MDVIIPAYNASRFIYEAIQSVLNQTLLPHKIIVVDDGSTDETVEIVKSFESNLIELISVKNGGVSRARNIGINASLEADYIAFLDADDLFHRQKLEKQIHALQQRQGTDIAYCYEKAIDENGTDISQVKDVTHREKCEQGNIFNQLLYEQYRVGNPSSLVITRSSLLEIGGFDENLKFSENFDIIMRLSEKYKFVCVPEILYSLRFCDSSTMGKIYLFEERLNVLLHHLIALEKWHENLNPNASVILAQIDKLERFFYEAGTDLRRADLRRADLRRADLRRADLRRADLRRADLRRADLRRADLASYQPNKIIEKFLMKCPNLGEIMGFNCITIPSVDVIIPAYNASRFIYETIQSVLNQTLLPHKIIVVDDGSTDETVEIVKSFESNLIELISVKNGGVSRARNIGINASLEADYIAFLDSDDIWAPTKLEAQLRQLGRNPAAGVCYSGVQLIDEMGSEIENTQGEPYVRGQVFKDIIYYDHPIYGSASSVIVSKNVLLQTNLFDETMQFSEDIDLWARLALLTEFDYASSPHVKIRIHSSSATRNLSWKKSQEILLQHFYYLNKFANQYNFSKETMIMYQLRIIRLFFNYPSKLLKIFSFYYLWKESSPHLLNQLGYKNVLIFIGNIFWITSCEAFQRIRTRAMLVKRLKLFFLERTIFFSKSKKYNPDVESIRKKR